MFKRKERRSIFPREIIGGDSVESIKRRLLQNNPLPSSYEIQIATDKAKDLFDVKVDIIRLMSVLHPEGDWLGRGARALDNPRTSTGEDSLLNLFRIKDELEQGGPHSQSFLDLKQKVFLQRDNIDTQSQA